MGSYEDELAAYSAYLNGLPAAMREMDEFGLGQYIADLEKAKAAMEAAYLDQIPTREKE